MTISNNCCYNFTREEWRNTCIYAAKNGDIYLLMYAHINGLNKEPLSSNVYIAAVESGDDECIEYTLNNGCSQDGDYRRRLLSNNIFQHCVDRLNELHM